MASEPSQVKRNFIVAAESTTIGQLRDTIVSRRDLWLYVVARIAGKFSVFRLDELIESLRSSYAVFDQKVQALPLKSASDLLAQRSAGTVEEEGLSSGKIRALFRDTPRARWVVLRNGTVTGVLAEESRSSAKIDLEWITSPPSRATPAPPPQIPPPPSPAPRSPEPEARPREAGTTRGTPSEPESYTLSAEEPPAAPAPAPPTAAEPGPPPPVEAEKRFINAELDPKAPEDGLKVGERYTIAFGVDVEARGEALAVAPFKGTFATTESEIELTVQLSSDEFEIKTEPQILRVPRRGKSQDKARFEFIPKQKGPGTIQAVFLKNGNFIQLMTVHLTVGAPAVTATSESLGRPLEAGLGVQPRDVTLILMNDQDGFKAILSGPVAASATLAIQRAELDQMINQAREALLSVVRSKDPGGSLVYQKGISIPEAVDREALKTVAQAGFRLFQRIFFGPAADAQANLVGTSLRRMAREGKLKIQIVSKDFLLPWGILYMADPFDPDHIDPELFLGFKHVVEHIPLQQGMHVTTSEIDGRPRFSVSLNLNSDIDQQMHVDVIARQRAYWEKVGEGGKTVVTVRETDSDVKKALAASDLPDQLLYFYCHAVSQSLSQGGPDASALVFAGNGRLTLGDLQVFAPMNKLLKGSPLVFINACESAELSPLFYDGFVPYFMGKGARGVIGTECLTPALFAAEWAEQFFDRFLQGRSVGEIFLELRQEFYKRHRNLLGLLYAVYCDGDTQLIAA